ncbi:MAG TPA: hypothetical protein VFI72_11655, partial [Candidatus Angelobacter sp.]|nr:hypothetical protein [Candidatus Angelobacter sp.]
MTEIFIVAILVIGPIGFLLWCLAGCSRELRQHRPECSSLLFVDQSGVTEITEAGQPQAENSPRKGENVNDKGKVALLLAAATLICSSGLASAQER